MISQVRRSTFSLQRLRLSETRVALVALVTITMIAIQLSTAGVEQQTNLIDRFQPPSWNHLAGTDQFGRDVLSLVGAGAVRSLSLAGAVVIISAIVGTCIALVSAAGRFRRSALVSVSDVVLAVPTLVVALIVAATIGSGTVALLAALVSLGWTPYFRLVLAQLETAQQQLWVDAAVASGASPARVLVRHILPNVSSALIALIATRVGHAVVSVSSLSFLGVGPQPPSSEWGAVLAAAQPHAERAPWAVVAPSLAILATTALAMGIGRRITARLR
jgi:peptide/nickel transport system permease protein